MDEGYDQSLLIIKNTETKSVKDSGDDEAVGLTNDAPRSFTFMRVSSSVIGREGKRAEVYYCFQNLFRIWASLPCNNMKMN